MKYLFFDTESANCRSNGNIFSFGYLLTDEQFNVISPQEDIVINPRTRFDVYVKKHILAYKSAQIKTAPDFAAVYPRLREIMTAENVVCVGYGVENDLKFLNGDCERYGLEKIPATFYDVQTLIRQAENRAFRKLALEYAFYTGEADDHAHRSDADAYFTMRVAQEICNKSGNPLAYYIEKAPAFQAAEQKEKQARLEKKLQEQQKKFAAFRQRKAEERAAKRAAKTSEKTAVSTERAEKVTEKIAKKTVEKTAEKQSAAERLKNR